MYKKIRPKDLVNNGYVCKLSTEVEYDPRGQLVPIRLSPFRDPKCILPHVQEFLIPIPTAVILSP